MKVKRKTAFLAVIVVLLGFMDFGGCAWQRIASISTEEESILEVTELPTKEAVDQRTVETTIKLVLTPTALPIDVPIAISTAIPTPIYITREEVTKGTVWLEIPKIHVRTLIEVANVVYTTDGLSFDRPQEKPKWVPDWSSEIGLPGIALIYGHRQWGPVPKVFTDLDDLEPDDKVVIASTQNRLTYKVVETMVVDPEEVWPIVFKRDQQARENSKSQLMLLTCTPWGTDRQRLIVFLTLEEVSDASRSRSGHTSVE